MAATTQEVLTHHLHTFGKGDLAGVMADYSPESRLFTPNGMLKGPEAIRQLFTTQFKEFAKPGASFQMLRQDVDGTPPTSCGRPRRRTTATRWGPTPSW